MDPLRSSLRSRSIEETQSQEKQSLKQNILWCMRPAPCVYPAFDCRRGWTLLGSILSDGCSLRSSGRQVLSRSITYLQRPLGCARSVPLLDSSALCCPESCTGTALPSSQTPTPQNLAPFPGGRSLLSHHLLFPLALAPRKEG